MHERVILKQMSAQNPVKHIRWNFLQKSLAVFRRLPFSQKDSILDV